MAISPAPVASGQAETQSFSVTFDRCEHCQQAKEVHGEDGKCLFEASTYEPQKLDMSVFTVTWKIVADFKEATDPPKKPRPYPATSEAQRRKERRLRERAYKPPR